MKKFHYNEQHFQWERVDRVQFYKEVKIETVTYHQDYTGAENHREYQLTWPDGRKSIFGIDKRGGNIKNLKMYIDFKTR